MNFLAQNLRRAMHHLKETDVCIKTFQIYFSAESLLYPCSKVPSATKVTVIRNEASIMYYNNLQLEARPFCITKVYIRILHSQALLELRNILGACVGLGISSSRPTKQNKFKYCSINGVLNSV